MSYKDAYTLHMTNMKQLQAPYASGVNDKGIASPEGYNMLSPPPPYTLLQAAQVQPGQVGWIRNNPAAELYAKGYENQLLNAPADDSCNRGCLDGTTMLDPRVNQTKPLYNFYTFKSTAEPTAYTAVGMY